ncbi:hypothetical protein PFDG_05130 [Plasmodium falciparum Dd2]|uniref:Uncharacterized protein n=1 Tax=Plasmodium falciparum (isolate Dd2) TaxID=57267 RepID=A0A0L7M9T0_PLAF4|nr:hypothetical protein PFDG_05130 [Plasmodium falciparum Dd2]
MALGNKGKEEKRVNEKKGGNTPPSRYGMMIILLLNISGFASNNRKGISHTRLYAIPILHDRNTSRDIGRGIRTNSSSYYNIRQKFINVDYNVSER